MIRERCRFVRDVAVVAALSVVFCIAMAVLGVHRSIRREHVSLALIGGALIGIVALPAIPRYILYGLEDTPPLWFNALAGIWVVGVLFVYLAEFAAWLEVADG